MSENPLEKAIRLAAEGMDADNFAQEVKNSMDKAGVDAAYDAIYYKSMLSAGVPEDKAMMIIAMSKWNLSTGGNNGET